MGDDFCREHEHFGRPCYRHHYSPRDGKMHCYPCGRTVDSARGAGVARKWQDKYGEW